ncbi:MAG TPA: SHOCT domain-containing protein [Ktedonobacteraceae bacterium]|nr:SHOCT domain-containing protein [Ktedonobacteraceae bacterium]
MPRGGGFGRGFHGGGFGMRRVGVPIIAPMGWGWGMGSPLMNTLMAGGLGYMLGSNSAQQQVQQPVVVPQYPPYPYQAPPPSQPASEASAQSGTLAQLQLLGQLHDSGVLSDDEFESEKQRILRGS